MQTSAVLRVTRSSVFQNIASLLAVGLLACLMGCSAMQAQNPGGGLKPVNAHVVDGVGSVMLKGHDVVSYFVDNKHALGSAQFASQYEGVTFHFASAAHKALFDKEPTKYLPQYGGYCTNGIVYGIPWGGDADSWMASCTCLAAWVRAKVSCWTYPAISHWPTSTGRKKSLAATAFGNAASA
jgi:YHS domain-containing protein